MKHANCPHPSRPLPSCPALAASLLALALVAPLQARAHENAADSASAAAAAEKAEPPGRDEKQARIWFDMLDTNRDGRLQWKEVRFVPWKPLREEFHTADTDGDGALTPDEIRVLAKRRVAERRARKARQAQQTQQAQPGAANQTPPEEAGMPHQAESRRSAPGLE